MNLSKFKLFLIILFSSIFIYGCSNDDDKNKIDLSETSSITDIEFEKLDNIKKLTSNIVNQYNMENDLNKLGSYFESIKNNFDEKTFNSNFDLKNKKNIDSLKRNYVIDNYQVVDTFYDSLSEKGILEIVYLVNVKKDYSDFFENVVLTDEYDFYTFKYSIKENKIIDFKYYTKT